MGLFDKLFSVKTDNGNRERDRMPMSISITFTELKRLLNQEISPILLERGMRYNGEYTWFGNMKNHMRKSVSVYLLKGSAIFQWAITFDFIPMPSGSRLVYNRTEKSIKGHLFEFPTDYYMSFHGKSGNKKWIDSPCMIPYSGKDIAAISKNIRVAYSSDLERLSHWQDEFVTLQNALQMASDKIDFGDELVYSIFTPSPVYIKAFLLAAIGKNQEGKDLLAQYLSSAYCNYDEAIKNKLQQRLNAIDFYLDVPQFSNNEEDIL